MITIDKITGKLATPDTPPDLREDIVSGEPHTILYWIEKNDPRGPIPENPGSDPEFSHWEYALHQWLLGNPIGPSLPVPTDYDTVHTEANRPRVTVARPLSGDVIKRGSSLLIQSALQSTFPLKEVDVLFNDRIEQSIMNPANTINLSVSTADQSAGDLLLRIRATDIYENKNEVTIPILITP